MASVRRFYWIILHHSFSIRPLMRGFLFQPIQQWFFFFVDAIHASHFKCTRHLWVCVFFLVSNWTGVCAHTAKQHVILDAVYTSFFFLPTTLWNASDFRSGWSYKFRNQRSNWVWMCSIKFDIMLWCKNGFLLCFAMCADATMSMELKEFCLKSMLRSNRHSLKDKEESKKIDMLHLEHR